MPEYYERVAFAYRFVREELASALGEEVLRSTTKESAVSMLDELIQAEQLFRGAAVVARQELGQTMSPSHADEAAAMFFRSWQRVSADDADLRNDMRVAVPV